MGDKLNGGLSDNLSNSLVDILSNGLGCNPTEAKPTTQSKIASIQKLIEELSKLLNSAVQQNIQLGVQNAELIETNGENHWEKIQPEATNTKSFNVTHPEQYCRGPQNLENVIDSLWSNSQYHWHWSYYGDSDKV